MFQVLQGHKYMSLTTFRRSGAAVATPVWFAQNGERLYVFSLASAGKVKRIRNNALVELAPCTARGELLGPAVHAAARLLPEAEEPVAYAALRRKYGWLMSLGTVFSRLLRRRRAYIEFVVR